MVCEFQGCKSAFDNVTIDVIGSVCIDYLMQRARRSVKYNGPPFVPKRFIAESYITSSEEPLQDLNRNIYMKYR